MPFNVHPWDRPAPMTEVYLVEAYENYDWDEGRLFRHDETGLYAFIEDSGCSCHSYLEYAANDVGVDEFMLTQDWTPLEHQLTRVIAYIESDGGRKGPAWVVAEKARFATFLQDHRR